MAAAAIAKSKGAFVASTSRNPDRADLLKKSGADQVIIDSGAIAAKVKEDGLFDKVRSTWIKKERTLLCSYVFILLPFGNRVLQPGL